jgi:hypothetical protein
LMYWSNQEIDTRTYPARCPRVCLTAHEGNHIISEAMTTIAR